ncbi:gluconokinase [Vibrio brasiliensis]|uniref:gluconokinase n=1 Tax=Vibrio brasiliensis TaxID=170652 RepID=UPI001EFE6B4F|nr:gluconokinase [Vibrio brasiliensis]MCG9649202.1 gluconokinase [Vibrio brasiliensis]MCG9725280.1 gluconokinase [Vibrio brasiliensis]
MKAKKILVMGVSGCGKSLIGSELAKSLKLPFYDGDDFHPQANVEKMRQGIPLDDADRSGWLDTLNKLYVDNECAVIACSALKPEYRDILRRNNESLVIVYLKGDFDTIWARHKNRANHYFNGEAMLRSQFDTLVEPDIEEALHIDIAQSVEQVLQQALTAIEARSL